MRVWSGSWTAPPSPCRRAPVTSSRTRRSRPGSSRWTPASSPSGCSPSTAGVSTRSPTTPSSTSSQASSWCRAHTAYTDAQISVVRKRSVGGGARGGVGHSQSRRPRGGAAAGMDVEADFATSSRSRTAASKRWASTTAKSRRTGCGWATGGTTSPRETRITVSGPAVFDREGITCAAAGAARQDGPEDPCRSAGGHAGPPRAADGAARAGAGAGPVRGPRRVGGAGAEAERRVGGAQRGSTSAAWSTWRRCASRRRSRRATSLPAAGLPWFMAMFGRDSILTSLQTLPFAPELAAHDAAGAGRPAGHPLRRLPRGGSGPDPARDALRGVGRLRGAAALAVLRLRRRHPAVRGPARRVRAVERRRATWCRSWSRRPGPRWTGSTTTPTWSATATSPTSAATRRPAWTTSAGRTPGTPSPTATAGCPASPAPPASCRVTPTTPRSAAPGWPGPSGSDPAYADRLERDAAELKRRFNRDFWIADGEYYALGLDGDGRQVDALSSNIGHLLWSGIVDRTRAGKVVEHLIGPAAVHRLGRAHPRRGEQARYNPIGYHVGTVWPFDNSFIAWGLRRYGFHAEAARIAAGILDAAEYFDGRLPEAFGGYERALTRVSRAVPDGVQPAGLVDRSAAAAAADDARPGAAGRPARGGPGRAERLGHMGCSTSPAGGAGWTPSGAAGCTARAAG